MSDRSRTPVYRNVENNKVIDRTELLNRIVALEKRVAELELKASTAKSVAGKLDKANSQNA